MGWIGYVSLYFLASAFLGTFFLIIRYAEENPNVNVLVYCLLGLLCGWVITPIIILGYVFKGVVFGMGWITIKLLDWFNI